MKGAASMALIPKNTCRKCNSQYSGLKNRCPYCGARRTVTSTRAAASTSSTVQGSHSRARAEANTKWQIIFGGVLLVAVVVSVIILITVSLKNRAEKAPEGTPAIPSTDITPFVPTMPPTAPPVETPTVSSITITFLDRPSEGFSVDPGAQVQMGAQVYPLDAEAEVTWKSSNESIFIVDSTGLVTGVSTGSATLTATCGAVTAECPVWVR